MCPDMCPDMCLDESPDMDADMYFDLPPDMGTNMMTIVFCAPSYMSRHVFGSVCGHACSCGPYSMAYILRACIFTERRSF